MMPTHAVATADGHQWATYLTVGIDTDHPFSDPRIALQSAIILWLASLL
jgi:hypothetical protein